jgi:DNA-binding CsgD family transcriptional regulator
LAKDRELEELRELLDRAVLDTQLWRAVCDKLAEFLGGVGAAFVPEDIAQQGPWIVSSASLSELIAAIFRDDWHLRNYRRRAVPIIKRQGVATDFDIADAATMRREPFYTELLAPQKIGNFIGLNVEIGRQTWIASVERGTDAAPPDQALTDRALRVLPYLAAAVRSSFALGHNRLESWNDLVAQEDRGVFLMDYLGRVIDRNEASEAFLKTALRIRNRSLLLGDSRRDAQFQRLVEAACTPLSSDALPPPVLWQDENGSMFVADAVRLKPQLRAFHNLEAAMVIVRAVGRGEDGLAGLLKKSAKLTDAEIRVAIALFEGQSLTQFADQASLAIGTVRQQIKSVFRKTGTGRQAELVTWMRRLQSSDGA